MKDEPETAEQKKQRAYKRPEGCLISGSTKVKRVPGSILLTIDSKGMSFDESALNMSHYVSDFRFGRGHNERIAVPQFGTWSLCVFKGLASADMLLLLCVCVLLPTRAPGTTG